MIKLLINSFIVVFIISFLLFCNASTSSSYYYDHWCGGELEYLDDRYCQKIFPKQYDREWKCPSSTATDKPSEGFSPETSFDKIQVDTTSLQEVISDQEDVNLCIVITQRVEKKGTFNKYFCLGEESTKSPYETWSSSKIFAIANAAGHLRTNETNCQKGPFGLRTYTTGNKGVTSLGDLISIICSYDETAGYTSNSLSSYFHDIGWRERLNDLVIHDWLGASSDETLVSILINIKYIIVWCYLISIQR